MRIVALVHMYPPHHNAGAELMLHTLLRDSVKKGHEVRVLAARSPQQTYVYQGVTVSKSSFGLWFDWADVAVTHLDLTRSAVAHASARRVPLVHIVHNERQLTVHGVTPKTAQLVVFNSRWIATKVEWPGRQIIVRPPVIAADYRGAPGEALTLVNLSLSKGAELFYELAERMPERRFLGVKGAYARQIVPTRPPSNVEIIENTPDMRTVYSKTRLLLMPSDYESWGRVGIEAAASGIPTIAHPTPGLLESLGASGTFVDRSEPDEWARAIRAFDEPVHYGRKSAQALWRSGELDPRADLALFERSLQELVG